MTPAAEPPASPPSATAQPAQPPTSRHSPTAGQAPAPTPKQPPTAGQAPAPAPKQPPTTGQSPAPAPKQPPTTGQSPAPASEQPLSATDGRPAPASPADFGWSGPVRLPDLWDHLVDRKAVVPFALLVRARQHSRDRELRAEARAAEQALREKFVAREGTIQYASYCEHTTGGCALTERVERIGRHDVTARKLHTVLNSGVPELVAMEAKCGALAENAVTAFCGRPTLLRQLRTSTDMVFSVMTRVLRAANELATVPAPDPKRRAELIKIVTDEYGHARRQINSAIQREARFIYLQGALLGGILTIAACVLLGLASRFWWPEAVATPAFVPSIVFGALGAITSVFQRMSTGRLVLDFTASRRQMVVLGGLRPFVGAVFGAIVHFGLVGGVLGASASDADSTAIAGFSAITGFAAGFSERLATDMVERAGRLVAGDPHSAGDEDRTAEAGSRRGRGGAGSGA